MRELDPQAGAAEADAVAEAITLTRVDEVGAAAQPPGVVFHVVDEYDELGPEQVIAHDAVGIEISRPSELIAAGEELAANADADLARGQAELVEDARTRFLDTVEPLSPYVRRPPKATIPHYATKGGLFLGEGLGLFGALLWLGEVEWVAAVMGVSVATATLIAGLSGAEVKDLRGRALRHTDPKDLTDGQRKFAHLFAGPDSGWGYVKAVLYVSVAVALTLAVTIGTLRGVVDEPVVGIVFGTIGVAVSGASWLDSYFYADEIADLIARTRRALEAEERILAARARGTSWRRRAEARAEVSSLLREQGLRGQAAQHHMRALLARVLRNNPGVAGNGRASESAAIGQTARRSGGAK
ncbi:hypothetical protein [uncultured Microbacterium sp.]|uniref:hypothetical protein n=1 Tax=uncultured Microbacterium sp. TaxID=191216 RepID=UPI0028EFCCBF|nr:hypothetical protein [uncultured Microbacterium sp.]